MMVVKVELWPAGDPNDAREVGRMALANVSNLRESSSYVFASADDRGATKDGFIEAHARSSGFWPLLAEIFTQLADEGTPVPESLEETLELIKERMGTVTQPQLTVDRNGVARRG